MQSKRPKDEERAASELLASCHSSIAPLDLTFFPKSSDRSTKSKKERERERETEIKDKQKNGTATTSPSPSSLQTFISSESGEKSRSDGKGSGDCFANNCSTLPMDLQMYE